MALKYNANVQFLGTIKASALTTSRALIVDSSGFITHSSVTSTELGYLSGVTSSIQTQLNAKADDSLVIKKDGSVAFTGNQSMGGNKLTGLGAPSANGDALRYDMLGANSGIATLDAGGKVPASQLPNSVMEYKGTWNASTNSPSLADGSGNAGDVYVVSVAGSQNLGSGSISFAQGDWIMYNGSTWEKSVNSNAVASVNGATGVVTVNAIYQLTGDITAGPASGSESKAATIANDAVTTAKLATASVTALKLGNDVAGDGLGGGNGTPLSVNVDATTIEINSDTLRLADGGITNAKINASAAIAYSKLSLSGSIVNSDISSSAAIAYSKLSLSGSIVNADISSSAAIAYSKLSIADGDLTIAKTNGLQAALDAKLSATKYSTTWTNAQGASKTVTHSLNTRDCVVEIYDTVTYETVFVEVVRTDANTIDLTAAVAPTNTLKVLIIAL